MCSAHHDPSESLVPVSDISREKRGPCSETTGSATVQPQHLIPFSSAADRERPPRLSGWERQRFKDLSILQNAALSSLFADFSTNRTSQLSTLLGNFVHYWKKLYNTLFCPNKNELQLGLKPFKLRRCSCAFETGQTKPRCSLCSRPNT